MTDAELARARQLIAELEALLVAVAEGVRDPDEADAGYKPRHNELRQLLAKDTLPCLCPWASIKAWAYGGYPDWRAELERMREPLLGVITAHPTTPWRLVLYRRGGNALDLPFDSEFEESLTDEEWVVLDQSLRRELAMEGTTLLRNGTKAHNMPCKGGKHPQPTVLMYKIQEGASSATVVLRVFFDTAPNRTIVLLHGYNKGSDPTDRRERAEARVACSRRSDLLSQLADAKRAGLAVATPRDP